VRIPVCRTSRFIIDNYRAVAKVIDKQPNTVMHGDAHPGNVYFRNSEAGLLDWQAVRRGHPGRELSYTLITAGMGGMQAESIAMEGVKRGVAALTDLETVAALKQSLS
jgi:aminoglycoside phosphotransferase (APT) family kinase protein